MLTPETLACLEVAERFAEGQADQTERRHARARAFLAVWHADERYRHRRGPAKSSVAAALGRQALAAALRGDHLARHIGELSSTFRPSEAGLRAGQRLSAEDWANSRREENILQASMVRDIFGNPLRAVSLGPKPSAAAVEIARDIYANRAFDRMPELATALELAGCTSIEAIEHGRQPQLHARGCWVVDLVLEKD